MSKPSAVGSLVTSSKLALTSAPGMRGVTEATFTCAEVKRALSESMVVCLRGTYVRSIVPEPSERSVASTVKHPVRRAPRTTARRRSEPHRPLAYGWLAGKSQATRSLTGTPLRYFPTDGRPCPICRRDRQTSLSADALLDLGLRGVRPDVPRPLPTPEEIERLFADALHGRRLRPPRAPRLLRLLLRRLRRRTRSCSSTGAGSTRSSAIARRGRCSTSAAVRGSSSPSRGGVAGGWPGIDANAEATQYARDHFGLDVRTGRLRGVRGERARLRRHHDVGHHRALRATPSACSRPRAGALAPGACSALSTPNQRSILDVVAGTLYRADASDA